MQFIHANFRYWVSRSLTILYACNFKKEKVRRHHHLYFNVASAWNSRAFIDVQVFSFSVPL